MVRCARRPERIGVGRQRPRARSRAASLDWGFGPVSGGVGAALPAGLAPIGRAVESIIIASSPQRSTATRHAAARSLCCTPTQHARRPD